MAAPDNETRRRARGGTAIAFRPTAWRLFHVKVKAGPGALRRNPALWLQSGTAGELVAQF